MAYEIVYDLEGFDSLFRQFDDRRVVAALKKGVNLILLEEMQMAIVRARSLCFSNTIKARIGILERDEAAMYIEAGVALTEQWMREHEFGNTRLRARPYWRPPVWEAFYRVRFRIANLLGRVLSGG